MIRERKIILFVLIFISCYSLVKIVSVGFSTQKILKLTISEEIGLKRNLLNIVNNLEKRIGDRLKFRVNIRRDPLKLNRIIRNSKNSALSKAEYLESMKKMRLSCTILSNNRQTAIIKYIGKSYIVSVGDMIKNHKVLDISKKRVVLQNNGKKITLYNKPAPLAEIKYQTKIKLDELAL